MISFDYKIDPPEIELENEDDSVTCNGCGVRSHISKVIIQRCKDQNAPHWLLCNECMYLKLGFR